LSCSDPEESERLLHTLIQDQVAPIVEKIVTSKIRGATAEDVRADVLAELISHLRELKRPGPRKPIRDFAAYVAVTAYHGCDKHFRRAFPQRHRLENQLRYLLDNHVRFAIWAGTDGEWMCGTKARKKLRKTPVKAEGADSTWASSREAARLVERILDETTAPIPFAELVEKVAKHWRISDRRELRGRDLPQDEPSVETRLAQRGWLKKLWAEIATLPRLQRLALLLNLRDERGEAALTLLPATGVASMEQIAAALDLPIGELQRLWPGLPMDDLHVAERMGLTRQRVIDLRRNAREKLNKTLS
jgi:hypothetical protein